MRKANVLIKNRNGEYITYNDVSRIVLETDAEPKVFTLGESVSKSIDLAFDGDSQEVTASDDELFDRVVVNKPANLTPENIAQGVDIAGVVGTFEGAGYQPKLRTLTLSRSGNTITISNPSTNGSYVEKYLIFDNDEFQKEQTTTSFLITSLGIEGANAISVICRARGFEDSANSALITVTVYGVNFDLENLEPTNSLRLVTQNLEYTNTLRPINDKALPEDIEVRMDNEPCDFTWDSYYGLISVPNVTGTVGIFAFADDRFHLRRPKCRIEDNMLYVKPQRYTEHTKVYIDDVEIYDFNNFFFYEVVSIPNASRGFVLNANGYYESTNKGIQSSYSICRVQFQSSSDKDVVFECINYAETNYDYGIISQPDQALSLSSTNDNDSTPAKVAKCFKGYSTTSIQTVTITIPAGGCFIDIKYRKDGSVDNGYDKFQFRIRED